MDLRPPGLLSDSNALEHDFSEDIQFDESRDRQEKRSNNLVPQSVMGITSSSVGSRPELCANTSDQLANDWIRCTSPSKFERPPRRESNDRRREHRCRRCEHCSGHAHAGQLDVKTPPVPDRPSSFNLLESNP